MTGRRGSLIPCFPCRTLPLGRGDSKHGDVQAIGKG